MLNSIAVLFGLASAVAGVDQQTDDKSKSEIATETQAAQIQTTVTPVKITGGGANKPVFYDTDFDYLRSEFPPESDKRDLHSRITDEWKGLTLAPSVYLDLGGEFRSRFQYDDGSALNQLNGLENSIFLTRLRAYANLELGPYLRVFVEMIDARVFGVDTLGQLPVAEAKVDLRNAFAELIYPVGDGEIYFRGGQQELLFGAQRFITPLDWANSRRTFRGVRAGYRSADWDLSLWRTSPQLTNGVFDTAISGDATFSGAYATYRKVKNTTVDIYVFNLDNDEELGTDFNIWTIGSRGKGRFDNFLWEVEGALQTGTQDTPQANEPLDFKSYSVTAGIGLDTAATIPLVNNIWLYYDRAQGDGDPNDDTVRTFNQLFPLAHAYFGHNDLVGRRNIEALSLRSSLSPFDRMKVSLGAHQFWRESEGDALFNAGGVAIRAPMDGSRSIGQELTIDISYALTQRATLTTGYAKFFGGEFVEAGSEIGDEDNPQFSYVQMVVRF